MTTPLLQLKQLSKAFGTKKANDKIDLTVLPGRVHALVGENGAGKTTLMTMIAGTATPDSGQIIFEGEETEIKAPQQATDLGIGMVHQHFKLVPSLTVADNVFLGREPLNKFGTVDRASMERQVKERAAKIGMEIDPRAKIQDLSVGEKQRIEVLKALDPGTKLLILDEPTAVLTPSESEELFEVIRGLAKDGCAILFISHKLGEVLSIADELTVIRDGRSVGTLPAEGLSQRDVARMMVGRDVLLRVDHPIANPDKPVLELENVSIADDRGAMAVVGLNLSVRAGEVVGVAGVEGNGQAELAAAIAGLDSVDRGVITLKGQDITKASVATRRAMRLSYVPEDRHDVGTAPDLTVEDNLISTHLVSPTVRLGMINSVASQSFSKKLIEEYDVRGATPETEIGTLSGGNMQKVVIAREFSGEPDVLVVSQPTRGVDVGAMEFVHNTILRQRDTGTGVLVFSADLNEVMSLSDRLVVMYRGSIIAEFAREEFDEVRIGLAMAGVTGETEHDALVQERTIEPEDAIVVETDVAGDPGVENAPFPDSVPSTFRDTNSDDPVPGIIAREQQQEGDAATGTEKGIVFPSSNTSAAKLLAVLKSAAHPVGAVLFSLVIGAFIILALGENPLAAYRELFLSPLRSPQGIAGLISQFIPLVLLSSAVIISFRAGFFNIGGEGQLFLGAFAAAFAGFTFVGLPGPILTIIVLIFGALGGAAWGLIPGVLYARWKTDIIVTTLMMSTIASLLTAYLVAGPFQDPTAGMLASAKIEASSRLPMISIPYGFGLDLIIALLIVVVVAIVLTQGSWGLKIRELGQMNQFASYTGVNAASMSIQVMVIGGAIAGLAGALFVLGPNGGRFLQTFSPGYGFLGITVALLARLNPWAGIIAALFYADMMAGSAAMQMNTSVPFPLVNVMQGLIILTITASVTLNPRMRKRLKGYFMRTKKPKKTPDLVSTASSAGSKEQ